MKLEDQVVSLELAKKLRELGVRQESEFYWEELPIGTKLFPSDDDVRMWPWCAAFTVAELGEMLPEGYFSRRIGYDWYNDAKEEDQSGWISKPDLIYEKSDTEAGCRAKMLCYLIEQKIVEAK